MIVQGRFNSLTTLAVQAVTIVRPNCDLLNHEGFAVRIEFVGHLALFQGVWQFPQTQLRRLVNHFLIRDFNGTYEKRGPAILTEDGPLSDYETQPLPQTSRGWLTDAWLFINQTSSS